MLKKTAKRLLVPIKMAKIFSFNITIAQIETIRTKVMQQKKRIFVGDALLSGRCKTQDYVPEPDYSDT